MNLSHVGMYSNICAADDRLWIQRVPPKPPRPPRAANRKRKAPAKKAARASTSRVVVESEPEPEPEPELESDDEPSSKRRRTTRSGGRSSRAQAKESTPTTRRGTRRAKLQANKKLDAQAKELAEYQRQAALLASASPSRSSGRATRSTRGSTNAQANAANNASGSGRRGATAVGTRASARLRGREDDEDDEEWQQIPDDWLNDPAEDELPAGSNHRRTRGKTRAAAANKGKGRARMRVRVVVEDDEEGEEETEEDELKHLAEQAGLESDGESSVLTELSDEPEENGQGGEDADADADEELAEPESTTARATGVATPAKADSEPRNTRAKGKKQLPEEPESEQKEVFEEPQIPLPPGFVEWEAVSLTDSVSGWLVCADMCVQLAVTLFEWEHVAEPFEKATHYLEKALYKVLSQTIVPDVTERLRVSYLPSFHGCRTQKVFHALGN